MWWAVVLLFGEGILVGCVTGSWFGLSWLVRSSCGRSALGEMDVTAT